jgi:DNA polymerase III subunit delta'
MTRVAEAELGPVAGHDAAKAAWREAVASGRLHHGWLVRGPRGVGKARLAIQFALQLLGAESGASLATTGDDPVARLLAAGSHPDFRLIRKPVDDKGKEKSEIPVESIRALSEFFALRPALGGWRVAIVDAVDELNRFGANALLKTLEEPPERAVLILVSHGERMLPPTVRSRCRVLRLDALNESDTLRALEVAGIEQDVRASVARLAPGRPGRSLALHAADLSGVDALSRATRGQRGSDAKGLQDALVHAAKSDLALSAAMDALRMELQAEAVAESDPVQAGRLAAAALEIGRMSVEAPALNMDRAQTAAMALARTARWIESGRV